MRPTPVSVFGMLAALLLAAGMVHGETINVCSDLVELGIAERNAAGDGETDDAPVLQAVADYVADRHARVVFPPGTYVLDSAVRFEQQRGRSLELAGRGATIRGAARRMIVVSGAKRMDRPLAEAAGAFDRTLQLDDVSGIEPGDRLAVYSRRSSEPPTSLEDNSAGVEHLVRIAEVDTENNRLTLTAPLPWHQKASNNIMKGVRRWGYYRFTMHGFRFEFATEQQTCLQLRGMKDVTLRDMELHYTGPGDRPRGSGIVLFNTHHVHCEDLAFHNVMYALWPAAQNSHHTYVRCHGYNTRHTFVLSDSTHTTIRDSHGYDCDSHLDTHRGVNFLTIEGSNSHRDRGAFRHIGATAVLRDCAFIGFKGTALNIGYGGARAQPETYLLTLHGEQLDQLRIDDVLRFGERMTAAVVSIVEHNDRQTAVLAYQLRGKGYDDGGAETDLGSRYSGGQWDFTVANKPSITGQVRDHAYAQTALGASVVENCYFDASQSDSPAIFVGQRFGATIRDSVIINPHIGVRTGGAASGWNTSTRLENLRIVNPREAGLHASNHQDVEIVNCHVKGLGRQAVGLAHQSGMSTFVHLRDCRFEGLATAIDFAGRLTAENLHITDSDIGMNLHGNTNAHLTDSTILADQPLVRSDLRGAVRATPRFDPRVTPLDAQRVNTFDDAERERLRFWHDGQWRDESGDPITPDE